MQGRGRDFAPATSECPPITYASHMDILLTHTSALEAMRLPEFPLLVKRWGDDAAELPDRIPKVSELRGILESDPSFSASPGRSNYWWRATRRRTPATSSHDT